MAHDFASAQWIDDLWNALRGDADWTSAAGGWLLGPVALVVEAADDKGFAETVAVRIDVHAGAVRDVQAIDLADLRLVPTRISAGFVRWKQLVDAGASLVDAAMASKVSLVGDLTSVTRYRAMFDGITRVAATIDTAWQDDTERATAGSAAG